MPLKQDSGNIVMIKGEFRGWLQGKYQEYIYEHDAFNEPARPLNYYWHEYKWWLRKEFRKNQLKEKQQHEYNEKFNAR